MYPQKVNDEKLLELYTKHHNVWKVAEECGLCGQSVWERLKKLNVNLGEIRQPHPNSTSEKIKEVIRLEYNQYASRGELDLLSQKINIPKTSICRIARSMGLTDQNRMKLSRGKWKHMTDDEALIIWDDFKKSSLNLNKYCKKNKYNEVMFWKTMSRKFPDEYEDLIETKQSKQTPYRVGRQFEYKTRDYFRKIGYFVLRSPKSKSPVDLIAIKKGKILFIQCKKGGAVGVAEWNKFYELCLSVEAEPIIATDSFERGKIIFEKITGFKDGSKSKQPKIEIYDF